MRGPLLFLVRIRLLYGRFSAEGFPADFPAPLNAREEEARRRRER